ncbi:MAG: hypothetical protein KDM91_09040 [Verrucomicrobiae bacterium]|nr:hypothetical protein [Verrucomicrobiae bacterium]
MKPHPAIPIAGFLAVLAWLAAPATGLRAQDVLHLKTGQTVPCAIEAVTDNIVTFRLPGMAKNAPPRSAKMEAVEFIEFAPLPGEAKVLADPAKAPPETLEKLWTDKSRLLGRPRSNAGALGVLHARALLRGDDPLFWQRAIVICDRVRERDWDEKVRHDARETRVQALIRLERFDEARKEVAALTAETDDPGLTISLDHALARADLRKLIALQAENPRWEEDDFVRPERNRLYHEAVDRFLRPFLFHGTRETEAARGLLDAAEAHAVAGNEAERRAVLADLLAIYPNTEAAAAARGQTDPSQTKTNPTDEAPKN